MLVPHSSRTSVRGTRSGRKRPSWLETCRTAETNRLDFRLHPDAGGILLCIDYHPHLKEATVHRLSAALQYVKQVGHGPAEAQGGCVCILRFHKAGHRTIQPKRMAAALYPISPQHPALSSGNPGGHVRSPQRPEQPSLSRARDGLLFALA